jgi:glycosyltransferase involved in cell wall biosynthesis
MHQRIKNQTLHKSQEIIIISSVPPAPTTGGEILLYRHFYGSDAKSRDWNIQLFGEDLAGRRLLGLGILKCAALRLSRTRYRFLGNDLAVIEGGRWMDKRLVNKMPQNRASLVLTVAHGNLFEAAQRYAKRHHLPLATFFHDWWPDMPYVHKPFRKILDRKFRRLYARSQIAFCVSEGMKKALGPHPCSHVLYPISDTPHRCQALAGLSKKTFTVKYFGNLFEYGPMLGNALREFQKQDCIRLEVRGANPQWPEHFKQEMTGKGLWLDFAPRGELNEWLSEADAFLIPMVFEPRMRRRMQTSFPSKLVEFAQFGKPLIVWGPPDCSAIQWANCSCKALCVNEESTSSLLAAVKGLFQNSEEQLRLAAEARKSASYEFNPRLIQQRFLEILDCESGRS